MRINIVENPRSARAVFYASSSTDSRINKRLVCPCLLFFTCRHCFKLDGNLSKSINLPVLSGVAHIGCGVAHIGCGVAQPGYGVAQ